MNVLLLLTAVSSLACAACAGLMCAQLGNRRFGPYAPLTLATLSGWGLLQLASNLDPDPARALMLARASTLGWIFLGPLVLGIFIAAAGRVDPRWRRLQQLLFATGAAAALAGLFTPWVIAEVERGWWGWAIVPGRLFPFAAGWTVLGTVLALHLGRRAEGHSTDEERRGQRWIIALIGAPIALVGVTDVALPMLGVPFPLASPTAFGPVAVVVIWLRLRMGYSPLTPGQVAGSEILAILPDGVALLGADDRIRLVNDSLARLCGANPVDLQGVPVSRLLRWDGDAESSLGGKGELIGADGLALPVAVRMARFGGEGGRPAGRVLVVRDLREVAQLRGQLAVSARLAAVGELAAGIAHEINNPLAFVRANLSQLESSWKQLRPVVEGSGESALLELLSDCDELIEESLEGVDRAVETVRGVKSFAHAGSAERELCDMNPLLEEVLKIASTQLRGRVNVIREFDGTLRSVLGSPQQLKQVFLNLVVNAAQAVGPDGTVLVATRREGGSVVVSVADDGCGIPVEHLDRLFDPFFTTKPVGEGTGLGLGISHQIVTRHGGVIEVESEPGQGSVFRVRLPMELDSAA